MNILCINDKDKPRNIPKNKWIKEGEEYSLLFVNYSIPSNTMCFQIAEIDLDESCAPYHCFDAKRFAIRPEDLDEFEQLVKDCTDFNNINITELVNDAFNVLN